MISAPRAEKGEMRYTRWKFLVANPLWMPKLKADFLDVRPYTHGVLKVDSTPPEMRRTALDQPHARGDLPVHHGHSGELPSLQ
jgi:hypothetical protein